MPSSTSSSSPAPGFLRSAPSLPVRTLLLTAVVCVALLGGGELLARYLVPPEAPSVQKEFRLDSEVGWRLPQHDRQSGMEFMGSFRPALAYSTNNRGLKGERDYPAPRQPNEVRILCLGDSSTNFLHFDAYPEYLQRLLSEAFPKRTFWVQNAGIPGFSSDNLRRLARVEIPLFEPDVVTVLGGTCDAQRVATPDAQGHRVRSFSELIAYVSQASRMITVLRRTLPSWLVRGYLADQNRDSAGLVGPRCTPEEYRDNYLAIAALARRHEAVTALCPIVWRHSVHPEDKDRIPTLMPIGPYQEAVFAIPETEDLLHVDATSLFKRPDRSAFFATLQAPPGAPSKYLLDNGHLNLAGQELLAAEFARRLVPVLRKRFPGDPYNAAPIDAVFERHRATPAFEEDFLRMIPPEDLWKADPAVEEEGPAGER